MDVQVLLADHGHHRAPSFGSLLTAMVTPMTADGSVDLEAAVTAYRRLSHDRCPRLVLACEHAPTEHAVPPKETVMTTLTHRPHTALMVIDVQRGVMEQAWQRDAVVDRISTLVDRARADNVPVVWVQHSNEQLTQGSEAWSYVPELTRQEPEALIHKLFGDAFEGTDLEQVLAAAGIGHLVVTGAETDACIRSTIHGAFTRGYDVTLVGDAHTTNDQSEWGAPPPEQVITHTNLYWREQTAPGRAADVTDTEDARLAAFPPRLTGDAFSGWTP